MKTALRITLLILTIFISRLYLSLFLFGNGFLVSTIALWLIVIGIGLLTWICTGKPYRGIFSYSFKAGITMGVLGFVFGFLGPMIFMPYANQGPLLGIIYSGPASFLIGLIGGAIYWITKKHRTGF